MVAIFSYSSNSNPYDSIAISMYYLLVHIHLTHVCTSDSQIDTFWLSVNLLLNRTFRVLIAINNLSSCLRYTGVTEIHAEEAEQYEWSNESNNVEYKYFLLSFGKSILRSIPTVPVMMGLAIIFISYNFSFPWQGCMGWLKALQYWWVYHNY